MILGVDFASIDGNRVDAKAAYAAGVRFAYMRASFGGTHDPTFRRNADALRAAGIVVGAYAAPDFHANAKPVADQIQALSSQVVGGRGDDLPPALGFELTGRGAADTGRTQTDLRKLAADLVGEARARFGIWPMIYTSHVQMCDDNEFGGFPVADGPTVRAGEALPGDCPLWLKIPYRLRARQPLDDQPPREPHYGDDPHDPADFYRVPPAWKNSGYFVLQFQGDATAVGGFSATVDVNSFKTIFAGGVNADPRVMWIQRRLIAAGEGGLADGFYGPTTNKAVRAFQRARQLPEGPVDLATFCALAWVP